MSRVRTKSRFRRLWRWGAVVCLGCLGAVVAMWFIENLMVYPAPRFPLGEWDTPGFEFEEIHFNSEDDTRLCGWYLAHPQPAAVIVYCHGNGENVAHVGPLLDQLRKRFGATVFGFDYRGYGKSAGSPTEAGCLMDGRAAMRWTSQRTGLPAEGIVVMGRSLGGSVAVEIAASRGAQALLLDSAFSSLVEVAAAHYRFLPVRLFMRNQYDSMERISRCTQPLFMMHGTRDGIVPIRFGRKLFDASPSQRKQFVEMIDVDHNDPTPAKYLDALSQFIDELR